MAVVTRTSLVAWLRRQTGEVPEWLKGTDCKSVGYAYVGSNPTLSTTAGPEALKREAGPVLRSCPEPSCPISSKNFAVRLGMTREPPFAAAVGMPAQPASKMRGATQRRSLSALVDTNLRIDIKIPLAWLAICLIR